MLSHEVHSLDKPDSRQRIIKGRKSGRLEILYIFCIERNAGK